MFLLTDLEACESTALPVRPDIHVRFCGFSTTSSGCARIDLVAHSEAELMAYVEAHWGDDDATGGWTSDQRERIETVPADFLRGEYVVTASPDDPSVDPLWLGEADNLLDALDQFATAAGFATYSALIAQGDEDGWANYYEDDSGVCMTAVFTNYSVFAMPLD